MQIGVIFPQNEIGAQPGPLREYAQTVESLGFRHLAAYDHVLGADPSQRPGWKGYTHKNLFHEPFVLFGYLAALTRLELVTDVIILPQRQTALVAKQAAEIDVLSEGKLRLGVGIGWNPVEYEALGMDFHTRGKAIEEQIEVLRLLWSQEIVSYQGRAHTIVEAGLNPLPTRRIIPIWMGGSSPVALKRIARLADGWFPQGAPDETMRATLAQLRAWAVEAGRDPAALGIEGRINAADGDVNLWASQTAAWQALGATHVALNTMGAGYTSLKQHLDALKAYAEAVKL
ncbi:MAG TPA: LLM class F420-dependent oxidoreductase [Ktedonobacteraceae bacterium]|nr:LLM class F420-dependent oxidoreductase [Ktedonobacteraceae bacterium]